ncbi:MAG: sulfite exporter TauE/SafE family protein [Deltaproteobacteria bacterium]|nr:sulfite exporter TauE/SafE family protein [Deltaproteobacteria bacterium]
MDTVLFLAFTTGLLGGFGHCVGMCGPIAAAYVLPAGQAGRRFGVLAPQLIYSAGRLTTYVLIGALMGWTGTFVATAGRLAGIQNLVALLAGLFMIASGLGIAGLLKMPNLAGNGMGGLWRMARRLIVAESVWKYYPLGLLLGFMPCGLSYSLYLAAAGSGSPLAGMATMVSFGLGTLPALLLFASLVAFLGNRSKERLYRAGGIAVALLGVLFLLRGLGLYG